MPEAGPVAITGIFIGCLFTFVFLSETVRLFWMLSLKSSLRKWTCLQQSAWDSVPDYKWRESKPTWGKKGQVNTSHIST